MKAMVIEKFGPPDVFQMKNIKRPDLIEGHILIKVKASSVNPVDFKIRKLGPPFSPDLPAVLHGDLSGVIEAVGSGVTGLKAGDEVYACAGGVKGTGGALAEYILADAELVAKKPSSLSFVESAVLPLVSITAWEGLIERARIKEGQKVLIHGATGGVGHIGIQIARWAGATVFTTGSSEEKLDIARNLGAHVGINYKQMSVKDYVKEYTDGKGFDVVFDTVGGENLDRSFEAAGLNGTVISIAARSTNDLTPLHMKGLTLHVVFMLIPLLYNINRKNHGNILRNITSMVDEKKIKPLLYKRIFNFEEVSKAHRLLEEGGATGKIALLAWD